MRAITVLFSIGALTLATGAAQAQEPATGQLLVASAALDDPNYSETVLLIVHHDQEGSLAVALNRPTWIRPEDAFPDVPDLGSYSNELYFGGPMSPNQLLIVYASDVPIVNNSRRILDDLYVTVELSVLDDIDPAAEGSPQLRFYAGHAAWNPGQLEAEIAAGNWRVLPATSAQVFDQQAGDLWDLMPLGASGVSAALR